MRIALYQPDIPQNTGTILRLAACLGVGADLIEPAGFPVSDKAFRRAGMDYLEQVALTRHASFGHFDAWRRERGARLVLVETDGVHRHETFAYRPDDILLLGRESAGVPDAVRATCETSLRIAQMPGVRSLNVAVAAAIVLAEGLRQTSRLPAEHPSHRSASETLP
jgi:tRNA (cytidine/uridine-2'-O-)-methyltransferase